MRNDLKVRDIKKGWFITHMRVVTGEDIINWFTEHIDEDKGKAVKLA
jgi:hypothetical protein